jgi:hypothetical protein
MLADLAPYLKFFPDLSCRDDVWYYASDASCLRRPLPKEDPPVWATPQLHFATNIVTTTKYCVTNALLVLIFWPPLDDVTATVSMTSDDGVLLPLKLSQATVMMKSYKRWSASAAGSDPR